MLYSIESTNMGFVYTSGNSPSHQSTISESSSTKTDNYPDLQEISAVTDMPAPTNITTLRSFLGLVNYYQSFVPNMRAIRQPLDKLLEK